MTSLKVCDWSGHIFGASASPRSLTKNPAMSPSPIVHGGQHDDTKYVTFELLLHAAFVADELWGFMLEPARRYIVDGLAVSKAGCNSFWCFLNLRSGFGVFLA